VPALPVVKYAKEDVMDLQGRNFHAKELGPFESLLERDFMGFKGKYFLGAELGLTGCEVSLNRLPAGKGMPFVHSHQKNEELYIVLRGNGTFFVDGKEFPLSEGSLVRVAPEGERAWLAGSEDLYFICIQAEAGSLSQATLEDGFKVETKTSWTK
jgi:mannose-6-phosphate isomerase-like protein (cupin superfamily)